jgi:hypothetical protein
MDQTYTLPYPAQILVNQLTPLNFELEAPWSRIVDNQLRDVTSNIDEVETQLLDFIGAQMERLSDTFQETIKATRDLFAALVRLNATQSALLEQKRLRTTELLLKLETAMKFIRKV